MFINRGLQNLYSPVRIRMAPPEKSIGFAGAFFNTTNLAVGDVRCISYRPSGDISYFAVAKYIIPKVYHSFPS